MSDMSRAVVRARNALEPFGGDEVTEAIIALDRWLMRQDERTKRRLADYFGADNLPVSARPAAPVPASGRAKETTSE